ESAALERCVCVLEAFLAADRLGALLWSRCVETDLRCDSAHLREVVLIRLASLPALTANRLGRHTPPSLTEQQYYTHLTLHILHTLERICSALRAGQDCSVMFVSQLLGKVCMQGHGELVCGTLAPRLSSLTHSDALWQRVSCRLLENVPERWVESVITPLIHNLHGSFVSSALSRLLGNLVLKNKKVQFVLTHKLLLLQYHHPVRVLRSVLGYLALDKERRALLKQVLRSVCQVWCNSSAVRHTPVEQQLYVSKSLLLCVCLLQHPEIQELREDLLQCMLGGVQCRLDSGVERVRRRGMVVGECISRRLDTPTSQLKFQYEADEESRELMSLMEPQTEEEENDQQPPDATHRPEAKGQSSSGQSVTSSELPTTNQTSEEGPGSDSELDSDDELTPYDMSSDQVKQKATPPRYVRDCLDANKFASVSQVVEYLTAEFYSLNFSLRQRLDILQVLAVAAQELSEPITEKRAESQLVAKVTPLDRCGEVEHWREVVEKRIQSKTRRISKGVSQPHKATPNRYAPVAGYFFFPLLRNYDSGCAMVVTVPQATFDLLGTDHLVLGRLVHTLGLLMHLAINAPVATQMGKALLDFVWVIRFHADQMVRRGVLFSVCAVFVSMPSENLLVELSDDLVETRSWLADVAETDPDADLQEFGCTEFSAAGKKPQNSPAKPLDGNLSVCVCVCGCV
ncbi:hypothetical protein QTP86_034739, partial [Hemibagrus guttatus]